MSEPRRVPHELVLIKDGERSVLAPPMRLMLCSQFEALLAANLGSPRDVRLSHRIVSGETLT